MSITNITVCECLLEVINHKNLTSFKDSNGKLFLLEEGDFE